MEEIGIKSFNTMSKYVKMLEGSGVLFVDRSKNNTDDGIKTVNTYSFKNI
jgi:predicted transcriptional regulator